MSYLRSFRLTYVAHTFGLKTDGAHRAKADAEMTMKIFQHFLDKAEDQQIISMPKLFDHFGVDKPQHKIVTDIQESLF